MVEAGWVGGRRRRPQPATSMLADGAYVMPQIPLQALADATDPCEDPIDVSQASLAPPLTFPACDGGFRTAQVTTRGLHQVTHLWFLPALVPVAESRFPAGEPLLAG